MAERRNISADAVERDFNGYSNSQKVENKTTKFDVKNYLNTKLGPNENSKTLTIRLLPIDSETLTPFSFIKMHNIKVDKKIAESKFKGYVCLSANDNIDHDKYGKDCPLCEKFWHYKNLEKKAETEDEKKKYRELAKGFSYNDYCTVRCIERGHEEDGPKFWKFAIRGDKTDAYNQMMNIYNKRKEEHARAGIDNFNIFDLYEGRDLDITITRGANNKNGISIMDSSITTPISKDEEQINKWVDDEKTWDDVFVIKPYEYLKIVGDEKVPHYDKKLGKWVTDKNDDDSNDEDNTEDNVVEDTTSVNTSSNEEVENKPVIIEVENEDEEPLPF